MPFFSLSKVDHYRNSQSKNVPDVIDIKFPSEIKEVDMDTHELLIFIVDDDPKFMQILNTHFSKLRFKNGDKVFRFKVKNFATGKSCIQELSSNPDVIFLNYYINREMKNIESGKEVLDQIVEINPGQKVVILNELDDNLKDAFVENGLRDYIIQDNQALDNLNDLLEKLL